ncbi:DUF1311 domain-containing protein [Ralstonia solanacearum]|uniref:DUF1311 domain-containing protein n=1 Tax=Ralstonia solanacearum TaxID=305 RepID=A0AAW5ZMU3_RALSL|nr:lysozyme inhibitor LprI family protein [Ralstonia solanacearum]MDB0571428.1 DUF1311 domain-containing protein [Ralstonia solanacearum]
MTKERSDNACGNLFPRRHEGALPRRSDDLGRTGSDPIQQRAIGTLACTKAILAVSLLVSNAAIAAPDEGVVQNMARHSSLSPQDIRQHYNDCDSGVTPSMKICASYHWKKEDIRLNRLYARSMEKAKEMGFETLLVQAQRAWLTYRDAVCLYEGQIGAGGGA